MRYSLRNGLFWLFIYILLGLVPIGIAIAGELPDSGLSGSTVQERLRASVSLLGFGSVMVTDL